MIGADQFRAARAYLGPAKGRANLTIATVAHATRILFEGNKAVGVEYQTPSGKETAWAKGEIVVSGGVYGSPQLLQLSGLGPAWSRRDARLRPRWSAISGGRRANGGPASGRALRWPTTSCGRGSTWCMRAPMSG